MVFAAACSPDPEVARWKAQARNVTIVRDDWGIPHVYGKSDADVVFGVLYAQAEDDFNRIETNYVNAMGRLAEAEGENAIFRDLRMKLYIDPDSMKARYESSPEWLKTLMNAFADGLNYYLHKHPDVHPRVITRFEPWMALTFTDGSIGGDIERVSISNLRAFYGRDTARTVAVIDPLEEPAGSNGIAIAPANTVNGHALLLINPHTSFFFREEAQMVSDSGLNAYGAITWGQFFIYQGFNDRSGWMHTSSGVDNIDEYAVTVTRKGDGWVYRYGAGERPVIVDTIVVPFKSDSGMSRRTFTVYRTHYGPVVRARDGKWISTRLMEQPVQALTQSFRRTKARNLAEFRATMDLHTNSSNNTVYADADGNIAYFHANFIPRRNARFDWTRPVDGNDPATEWGAVLAIDESPNAINPPNGWVQNTNNWPYSAAGGNSPRLSDYPAYVQVGGENARGLHAQLVLAGKRDFTLDGLIAAAFDPYLTGFTDLLPTLLRDYDRAPASHPLKARLAEQIDSLRGWDLRWSATSVPTTLAVFWGDNLQRRVAEAATSARMSAFDYAVQRATVNQRLQSLADASDSLTASFGTWKTPWGEINRFQRVTGDIVQPFSDSAPSIPVPFTSGRWGSLASFGAQAYPNTKKWYGTSGNSFVAVVEFGDSVRARAVTAGGLDARPAARHFNDQAMRYSTGDLRDVYFYRAQLSGHTEREYKP